MTDQQQSPTPSGAEEKSSLLTLLFILVVTIAALAMAFINPVVKTTDYGKVVEATVVSHAWRYVGPKVMVKTDKSYVLRLEVSGDNEIKACQSGIYDLMPTGAEVVRHLRLGGIQQVEIDGKSFPIYNVWRLAGNPSSPR